MSGSISQFGIVYGEGETEFAMAMMLTDDISILLMQQGVDVSSVNRLSIPAGFASVGTMTILCYLPNDVDSSAIWAEEELWAVSGPVKWKLSKNYRIHRIFAQQSNMIGKEGVAETLSILSIDDWRYDLNIDGSGTSTQKSLTNSYAEDFSVAGSTEDVPRTEDDGVSPSNLAELNRDYLHLYHSDIPSLDDPWNAWGYDKRLSKADFVDRVLTSCGVVAIPYLVLREGAEEWLGYKIPYDIGAGEGDWMVTEYIGEGWKGASESWNNLKGFYMNGQLQCAFGEVEDFSGAVEVEDSMSTYLEEVPREPIAMDWIGQPRDGTQEIPKFVTVQFPAKLRNGRIVLYKIEDIPHGIPLSENAYLSEDIAVLTDHIKTRTNDTTDEENDLLNKTGITEIVIDPYIPDEVLGLDEERVNKLIERALEISRTFYARYYACSGFWSMQGFHLLRPWAGCLSIEYGYKNGVPHTTVSSSLNDPRFGFAQSGFAQSSIVSSGGAMFTRPDGLTDLSTGGGGGAGGGAGVFAVQVENYTMNSGGCLATYTVKNLSNDAHISGLVPWREIGGSSDPVCYAPAEVGTIGIMGVHPDYSPTNPFTSHLYFLTLDEAVQTKSCS